MFKWLKYIGIGAAVLGVITEELPKALEDNQVTVGELVEIFVKLTNAAGYALSIGLPPDVRAQTAIIHKQKLKS